MSSALSLPHIATDLIAEGSGSKPLRQTVLENGSASEGKMSPCRGEAVTLMLLIERTVFARHGEQFLRDPALSCFSE